MRLRLARLLTGTVLAAAVGAAWALDEAPIRFEISRFEVAGNTLLPPADVDAAVAPFAGPGRDFGDVQRALEALEALYHARGYNVVMVQLPEQELNGGVVTLRVLQATIGRITVSGNKVVSEANVVRSVPTLRAGQTPNLTAISASLKLANENPARKINLKLQGGESEATIDARLEVADDKPWTAMLNLDNTGTAQTGKTHVSAIFQHANLWGRDHVGSVQYTTTAEEPNKVSVYGAGYHIPLYALGDSLDVYASYSNVDSGSVTAGLFNLAVSGRGAVYGARYNQVLAKRGGFEPRLVYGIDYKAYKNSVLLADQQFGNDVTVHPLSIAYLGSLPVADGEANVSATLVHNLAGGKRGGSDDFTRSRAGARAAYTIARLAAAYTTMLARDWQLRLLVNGQLSADALVSGEQFGAGGASSVRGFEERVLSTDSGINGNAELYTPDLCLGKSAWQCRVLAFYDAAHGSRNHVLAGELGSTSIAGAGLGVRVSFGASMNVQADIGHVVHAGAIAGAGHNKLSVRAGFSY
jgi:hemolysin activation/secretion protein